jgi:hypothetical protein
MTARAPGVRRSRSHNRSDRTLERADAVEAEGCGVGKQAGELHDRSVMRSAAVTSLLRGGPPDTMQIRLR